MVKIEIVIKLHGKDPSIEINRLRREDAILSEIELAEVFYKQAKEMTIGFNELLQNATGVKIPTEETDGDFGEGRGER